MLSVHLRKALHRNLRVATVAGCFRAHPPAKAKGAAVQTSPSNKTPRRMQSEYYSGDRRQGRKCTLMWTTGSATLHWVRWTGHARPQTQACCLKGNDQRNGKDSWMLTIASSCSASWLLPSPHVATAVGAGSLATLAGWTFY